MDKMLKAADRVISRDYRVYFYDGTQKVYNAKSIKHLMDFLLSDARENHYDIETIYKIEEVGMN